MGRVVDGVVGRVERQSEEAVEAGELKRVGYRCGTVEYLRPWVQSGGCPTARYGTQPGHDDCKAC